jgi:hypothetical protein
VESRLHASGPPQRVAGCKHVEWRYIWLSSLCVCELTKCSSRLVRCPDVLDIRIQMCELTYDSQTWAKEDKARRSILGQATELRRLTTGCWSTRSTTTGREGRHQLWTPYPSKKIRKKKRARNVWNRMVIPHLLASSECAKRRGGERRGKKRVHRPTSPMYRYKGRCL